MKLTKADIIKIFSDLARKKITDGMMRDLIDTLWREMYWLYKEGHLNDPAMIALTPEELLAQFPELVYTRNTIGETTNFSILLGHGHESNGDLSVIVGGIGNISNDYKEVIMGGYATEGTGNQKEWEAIDRLIVVGNGVDADNRHNALVIYKDGYAVFNNSVVVGDYEHGGVDEEGAYIITPVEGSIRFTPELGYEGWWNGEWVPFGGLQDVKTEMTVTGDGTSDDKVKLVNDEEDPGVLKYYGTDVNSTKGYHSLKQAIQEKFDFYKECYLIDNTVLSEVTQPSSWTVIALNELVGNFKATVVVHDKTTKAIVTLQNTFGFDYTDVLDEAADDNILIGDAGITLVLSIDVATRLLKAVVSNMTENGKRIFFCFERCVLGTRIVEFEGEFTFDLDMDGILDLLVELSGEMTFDLEMGGTLDLLIDLVGEVDFTFDMEGILSLLTDLSGGMDMNLEMEGFLDLLLNLQGEADLTLEMEGFLDLLLNLQGEADLTLEMEGFLDLLLGLQGGITLALGMDGLLTTEVPEAVRLYNWLAIINVKEIAPTDYHVANENDWANLLGYLGGYGVAGGKLKSVTGWNAPNTGATNEKGFTGLPHGKRSNLGVFSGSGDKGYFWIKNINT